MLRLNYNTPLGPPSINFYIMIIILIFHLVSVNIISFSENSHNNL